MDSGMNATLEKISELIYHLECYGFSSRGGDLELCNEWIELKSIIAIARTSQLREAQFE